MTPRATHGDGRRPQARPSVLRPLPPLAESLPKNGALLCALGWTIGAAWERFVIPPGTDAGAYDLRFVRGRAVTVLHASGHPKAHIDETVRALIRAKARSVCAMPPARVLK